MRADWEENERVRAATLDMLSRHGALTFEELMGFLGPAYEGRGSGSLEGRRLDRALQFHRKKRRIEYDRYRRLWRAVL